MTSALAHRGPDDSGVWVDAQAGVALGHRRLSILDLSPEGHQPMHSADGRLVIVFNGEIYNFGEIRADLEKRGNTFRGHSDTEVMLAAFREWGMPDSCRRFNGMFSFVAWDKVDRVLWLGRDRFGKKPLYYGWSDGVFLFGSELKALRAHPHFSPEVDRDVLGVFMRHGYVLGPRSIYRNIYRLPAASTIALRESMTGSLPEPQLYWSAKQAVEHGVANRFPDSPSDVLKRLEDLLKDAVALRMISDVPLGAFLSGGIDSSLVVALMQACSSQPVKTFSIGFNEKEFDEAQHAAAVAGHLGTDHTELYVTPQQAMDVIPLLPHMYDEPFADASQIPTYLVSKLARTRVTVSLSGDGGDEFFAGYSAYYKILRGWSKYGNLSPALRRMIASGIRTLGPRAWDGLLAPLGAHQGTRVYRLAAMLSQRSEETMYRNLISNWEDPAVVIPGSSEALTAFTDPRAWAQVPTLVEKMMYLDAITYLCDDILVKLDRATMAVSLEGRCPLLDYRIFEFAWRMPLEEKAGNGFGKLPLREILYRYVPRGIVDRPKAGFSIPIGDWLRGPMRDWAEELLSPSRFDGLFAPEPIARIWAEHLAGADRTQQLWSVLMFQAWQETANWPASESAALELTARPQ